MCNPGLRKHHWDAMSEIAGFNLTPDAGTTLRKVLKLELDEFMDKFEVISVSATKVCVRLSYTLLKQATVLLCFKMLSNYVIPFQLFHRSLGSTVASTHACEPGAHVFWDFRNN